MRNKLPQFFFLLCITCVVFSCSTRKVTPQLRSGIELTELPSIHKDSLTGKNFPRVRVDSSMFNGVFASSLIVPTDSFCVPFLLYNAWGGKCLCYAGYKNFEGNIFNNMKTALENKLSAWSWTNEDAQCELRVKIDSASIKTRYVYNCILAMGYDSNKEYCKPTEITLSVGYDLIRNDTILKSHSLQRNKILVDKICCEDMVLDSSNAGQYSPSGYCRGPKPGIQPRLVIHNTMNFSYYYFNQLITDCAQEISVEVRKELYK